MEPPGEPGLRPVAFPAAALKATTEISREEPGTPDPTEWRFGPEMAKPLRSLAGAVARKIKPERDEDQLPCPLEPSAPGPGAPNIGTRTCMRCWMSIAPLYCSKCTKYYCGPCAAKAHRSPDTQDHRVGTAVRGEVVDIQLPRALMEKIHGDSFALDLAPAAARSVQCPRHPDEPARFACLDCRCEILCSQCYAEGLHSTHELVNIRTAVPSVRLKMMDQYTKLKHQAQVLQDVMAALKSIQKKATKVQNASTVQIREAFESVIRALEVRDESANKEMEIVRNLSAQSLKSLDMDCQMLLRYLRLKKHQLGQLRNLASRSTVLALNAFADIAPTIDAIEEKTDTLRDMRERLRVPHWQLRVLEIDALLVDRQDALVDFSSRINAYCESASQAVEGFMGLSLPLEAPPAEHREAEKLYEAVETKRPPPVVYVKGMDPYTDRFLEKSKDLRGALQICLGHVRVLDGWNLGYAMEGFAAFCAVCPSAPDKFQAFVRKDQLHPQWEIRVVSLRGPYLCVHESEDDPCAPVESACVLGKNTFARTFADPGATALSAIAKKDYLHGIEVVTVDLKARELQSFLLLAADGQQLAEEWVEAIESECVQSLGLEPEAPSHDPKLALEDLQVEAAGTPFPVSHRRKAAMLPAELLGKEEDEEISPESSLLETDYTRSMSETDSMGDFLAEGGRGSSISVSSSVTDSEEAAQEALERVAAPPRPAIKREDTSHWERDAVPGSLYKRRQRKKKGELALERRVTEDISEEGSSPKLKRGSQREPSLPVASTGEETEKEAASRLHQLDPSGRNVLDRIREIEKKVSSPPMRKELEHGASSPERDTDASTPEIETLDIVPLPERQDGSQLAPSKRDSSTVRLPDRKSRSNSVARRSSVENPSGINQGRERQAGNRTIYAADPPKRLQREFNEDPQHGDSPPVHRRRQQRDAASPVAPPGPAADDEAPTTQDRISRGAMLNGYVPKAHRPAVSLLRKAPAGTSKASPLRSTSLDELPQSPGSPPLRSRFSYTAGIQIPRERRRRPPAPQDGGLSGEGEFLKLKMPPKKSLPTFVVTTQPAPRTEASAAVDAALSAVSAAAETAAARRAAGSTRIRRVSPPPEDPVAHAAAAAATVAAATAALGIATPRGPRRLLSMPALPSPPGAARLVNRQPEGAGDPTETQLISRVMQQIGSLKISQTPLPSQLRRANTTEERKEEERR